VNFQCWDIEQLQDLELLYMRPGYTVLVEWGWFPYLDNSEKLITTPPVFYDILNKPQTNRTKLFEELYQKSLDSGGNYDAMFGYIKNYQWSARADGGYDCTTTVVSTGEIIESLKINYVLPKINTADKSVLSPEFSNQGSSTTWENGYKKNILAGIWAEANYKIKDKSPFSNNSVFLGDKTAVLKIPHSPSTNNDDKNNISNDGYQAYITLECMFDILNKYVVAKSKVDKKPLVELSLYSTEYDGFGKKDLYCIAHPLQVSVDPSVCAIKSPLWYGGNGQSVVIQQTKESVDGDPDIDRASGSFELIKEGYEGAGTNELALLEGIEKINTFKIFNLVNNKIKAAGDYDSLEAVLNGELENGDLEIANQISKHLKKIGIEVIVTPKSTTYVDKNKQTVIAESTTDVKKIEIKLDRPLSESEGSAQNTIEDKADQAVAALKFLEPIKLDYFYKDIYSEVGIIKNIYVNLNFLYQAAIDTNLELKDNKDKNEINLYNYLKAVIREIQVSLGNLNSFEIHVDPVDNKARIIDVNYTEPEKATYDDLFELKVHNVQSVVRSYSMQSQIFPEQSSIVAIGAQVKGGQMGMQTNTMIDFNRSLTDRIIPEKVDGFDSDLSVTNNIPSITNGLSQIIEAFAAFGDQATSPDNKVDYNSLATIAKNALRDVIIYFQVITRSPGSNRNLIPTKLSLEMDGIGGLVIGHMFKLPKRIIPRGYRGEGIGSQLGNVITSIGHTIGNGDWTTKIDTLNVVLQTYGIEGFNKLDLKTVKEALKIGTTNISIKINTNIEGDKPQPGETNLYSASSVSSTSNYLFGKAVLYNGDKPGEGVNSLPHKNWGDLKPIWQNTNGWDIFNNAGTPIYALFNGTVSKVSFYENSNTVWGYSLTISGNDNKVFMTHMDNVVVNIGSVVKKGQLVGFVGLWPIRYTRLHFYPHTHLALEKGKLSQYVTNNLQLK
jgi:murein DD-endopeptidase MepM/ murein hydrolase activator NlpD